MIWLSCPNKIHVKLEKEGDVERFDILLQMHYDGCSSLEDSSYMPGVFSGTFHQQNNRANYGQKAPRKHIIKAHLPTAVFIRSLDDFTYF